MTASVDISKKIGLDLEEIKAVFDPQIFNYVYPENKIVHDLSASQFDRMITGQAEMRVGIAGILADANIQLMGGLLANFGLTDASLPAIYESDIDTSDAEMLASTLERARKEMESVQTITMPTLKCIARRQRPNGRSWVKCTNNAIRGDQYCPIHLNQGRTGPKNIRSLLIDCNLEDEELPMMQVMAGVAIAIPKPVLANRVREKMQIETLDILTAADYQMFEMLMTEFQRFFDKNKTDNSHKFPEPMLAQRFGSPGPHETWWNVYLW